MYTHQHMQDFILDIYLQTHTPMHAHHTHTQTNTHMHTHTDTINGEYALKYFRFKSKINTYLKLTLSLF